MYLIYLIFDLRVAVEVVSTKTTADVMWKDGRVEKGIRSNDLIPIQHLDSHEFCPGDFVVDKRREDHLLDPVFFINDLFDCPLCFQTHRVSDFCPCGLQWCFIWATLPPGTYSI